MVLNTAVHNIAVAILIYLIDLIDLILLSILTELAFV